MTNQLNLDNELRTGDIVGDTKRTVLVATKKRDRVPGDSYAVWVAICYEETATHPYVVWDVIARPEGFVAEHGYYAYTMTQAFNDYSKRGGQ